MTVQNVTQIIEAAETAFDLAARLKSAAVEAARLLSPADEATLKARLAAIGAANDANHAELQKLTRG